MINKKNFATAILTLLVLFSASGSLQAQMPGDIVIAEVGADPASALGLGEPANEFLVLCNRTGTNFNLLNWTLTDDGAATLTFPLLNLAANACFVVANNGIDLTAAGYNCPTVRPNIYRSPVWFSNNISNSSDEIVLRTPGALVIDAMSYGSNINRLNPPAPDVFNNSGASLIRTGYPTAPSMLPDTDTNAEWTSRAMGSPCDAPLSPTAAAGTISGRAVSSDGRGIKFVSIMLSGGALSEPIYATTNHFGHYRFEDLRVGESYVLQVISGRHKFQASSLVVNLDGNFSGADFTEIDFNGDTKGGNRTKKRP